MAFIPPGTNGCGYYNMWNKMYRFLIWGQKQTVWWTEEIRKVVGDKKTAYKRWIQKQTPENWHDYKQKRDKTKKMVTEAKVKIWNEFRNQLLSISK